jgi:hypothetical protein
MRSRMTYAIRRGWDVSTGVGLSHFSVCSALRSPAFELQARHLFDNPIGAQQERLPEPPVQGYARSRD